MTEHKIVVDSGLIAGVDTLPRLRDDQVTNVLGQYNLGLEDLQVLLTELVAHNSVNNISREVLDAVAGLSAEGRSLEAFRLIASNIRVGPLTKSPEKAERRLRKKIRAALRDDRTLEKGPSPPTFIAGRSAHSMLEQIKASANDLDAVISPDVSLLEEKGVVTGVTYDIAAPQQMAMFIKSEETINQNPRTVIFSEPLDKPELNQERRAWAVSVIKSERDALKTILGNLPSKPYDVASAMMNNDARRSLTKIMEAAYVIFGDKKGMTPIVKSDSKEADIEVLTLNNGVNEFAVLNWLAIVRSLLDKTDSSQNVSEGILTEMNMGNLKVMSQSALNTNVEDLQPLGSGVFDLGRFRIVSGESDVVFRDVTTHIQAQFHSQASRYRREDTSVDGRKVEKQTTLYRTVRSYFQELWRVYGDRIFDELEVYLEDFKFPGGDGGWYTIFNSDELPINGHLDQISEYLFWVAAQLAWVEKWSRPPELPQDPHLAGKQKKEAENFVLTTDEIHDFMQRHELCSRLQGDILYQTPESEIVKAFTIPSEPTEQRAWIESVVAKREAKAQNSEQYKILKALEILLTPRLADLQVKVREPEPFPAVLNQFCVQEYDQTKLVLEKLKSYVPETENPKEVQLIEEAVYFADEETYVFWLRAGTDKLRLAVNSHGSFVITGRWLGTVRGSVMTDETMRGVRERPESVFAKLKNEIWDPLDKGGLGFVYDNEVSERQVVLRDGTINDRVEKKPRLCKQDVMTGALTLDLEALKEIAETDAGRDIWGVSELSRLVTHELEGAVFCPCPDHKNINTEAAFVYNQRASERSVEEHRIYCFSCGQTVLIPGKKIDIADIHLLPPGRTVEEFKPVSGERKRDTRRVFEVGRIIAQTDNSAASYLVNRGINPDEDLGLYGYYPPELTHLINTLIYSDAYPDLKKQSALQLNQLGDLLRGQENSEAAVTGILSLLSQIPSSTNYDTVLRDLTMGCLERWRRRLIIGRNKKGYDRLGGRFVLPTYWFEQSKDKYYHLAVSNYIGRGIEIGGVELYEGGERGKHKKARVGNKAIFDEESGMYLRPTPTGVWMQDPEQFLLNVSDTVIIFEGAINHATFTRMRPDLKYICLTATGTEAANITIPFLRWLGVDTDSGAQKSSFGKHINRICLATDFDLPGVNQFHKLSEKMKLEFPGIKIIGVQSLLPVDVQAFIPDNDPKLFKNGGPLFGFKRDLNDLIRSDEISPDLCFKYAYHSS